MNLGSRSETIGHPRPFGRVAVLSWGSFLYSFSSYLTADDKIRTIKVKRFSG